MADNGSRSRPNDITTSPPTSWRRTSRRLVSVEVIDRDYLLRRPMVLDLCTPEGPGEGPPAADLDGPPPAKRICSEPDQSAQDEPYKCPVCLEGVSQRQPVATRCGHVFCQDCLLAALRTAPKCPLCNAHLKPHHFLRIYL